MRTTKNLPPSYRNQEKAFSFSLLHVKVGKEKKISQVKIHSSIKLDLCTEWFDYAVDVTCVYSVTFHHPAYVCLPRANFLPLPVKNFKLYPPHKVL